jgi:hypothetical protein
MGPIPGVLMRDPARAGIELGRASGKKDADRR